MLICGFTCTGCNINLATFELVLPHVHFLTIKSVPWLSRLCLLIANLQYVSVTRQEADIALTYFRNVEHISMASLDIPSGASEVNGEIEQLITAVRGYCVSRSQCTIAFLFVVLFYVSPGPKWSLYSVFVKITAAF